MFGAETGSQHIYFEDQFRVSLSGFFDRPVMKRSSGIYLNIKAMTQAGGAGRDTLRALFGGNIGGKPFSDATGVCDLAHSPLHLFAHDIHHQDAGALTGASADW